MKLRAHVEGLAVPATIAAVLAKDQIVTITGDKTVGAAGSNATSINNTMARRLVMERECAHKSS